jgi:hypothetical protein
VAGARGDAVGKRAARADVRADARAAARAQAATPAGADADEAEASALLAATPADGLRRRTPSRSRSSSEAESGFAVTEADAAAPVSSSASGSGGGAVGSGGGGAGSAAGGGAGGGGAPRALDSVLDAYRGLAKVALLPSMVVFAAVLVTVRVGFAATDKATTMLLQTRGVPKETLAFLDVVSFPVQLAAQVFLLSHWTSGPRALDVVFLWGVPLRAASALVHLWLVYVALPDRTADPWTAATVPAHVVALLLLVTNAHGALQSAMFMAQMAFATRVAAVSPRFGGSVMTLLNTLANLGSMLPGPLVLLAVGRFGYAPVALASAAYSLAWFLTFARSVRALQAAPPEAWTARGA